MVTRKVKKKTHIGGNKDRCIFLSLMEGEGLGNQLFIYAAGLTIQEKTHLPICMLKDTTNPHSIKDYRNLFDVVKLSNYENSKKRINIAKNVLPEKRYYTDPWTTNSISQTISSNVKIPNTLYQNYKSIYKIIPKMKKILYKNEFHKDIYNKYKDMINSSNTAFMHIRRGDKVTRKENQQIEYYIKGLIELEKNNSIKTIYIFSNDIEWCKQQKWNEHTTKHIIHYDNNDELVVLYMMMHCTAGAILSSSTFGIWGALLGADMNTQSTIVYNLKPIEYGHRINPMDFPKRWFGL